MKINIQNQKIALLDILERDEIEKVVIYRELACKNPYFLNFSGNDEAVLKNDISVTQRSINNKVLLQTNWKQLFGIWTTQHDSYFLYPIHNLLASLIDWDILIISGQSFVWRQD